MRNCCLLLLISVLTACSSSPPPPPEPEGEYLPINPKEVNLADLYTN